MPPKNFWMGSWRTWRGVLISPRATFLREAEERSSISAMLYSLVIAAIATLLQGSTLLMPAVRIEALPPRGVLCLGLTLWFVWLLLLPPIEWSIARLAGARPRLDALVLASGLALSPMVFGVGPMLALAMLPLCAVLKVIGYRSAGKLAWREAVLVGIGPLLLAAAAVYRLA